MEEKTKKILNRLKSLNKKIQKTKKSRYFREDKEFLEKILKTLKSTLNFIKNK